MVNYKQSQEAFFWSEVAINIVTAIIFLIGGFYRRKELDGIGKVQ